jgi:hypothetical protein
MPLTKKLLIEALMALPVPDDTPVVFSQGIGYNDACNVSTETLTGSSVKDTEEFLAIVIE